MPVHEASTVYGSGANTGIPPTDVPNLSLWLSSSSLGALADGAFVTEWLDSSGLHRDCEQSNPALYPTYHTNVRNGRAAVLFDGVDDCLRFPTEGVITAWTTIAVYKPLDLTNSLCFILGFSDWIGMYCGGSDPTWGGGQGATFAADHDNYRTANTSPPDWNVTTWMQANLYQDGLQLTTTSAGPVSPMVLDTVGNISSASNRGLHGYIGEIAYWPRVLTTPERTGVEAYLKNRWATP